MLLLPETLALPLQARVITPGKAWEPLLRLSQNFAPR